MQLDGNIPRDDLKTVTNKVLLYFKEFISTDFKRQQAPRRRIQLKTKEGFRTAIDLRKYPTFFRDSWAILTKPSQAMELRIGRSTHRASISPILRNLIEQSINEISPELFNDIRINILSRAKSQRQIGATNAEAYFENISAYLHEQTAKVVVLPLLTMLEGPFAANAYSAEDSIFEIESDLTEILCAKCAEQLPVALNTYLLKGDEDPLEKVLSEFLSDEEIKSQALEFFETFAAADAYQELRDVLNYVSSDDTLTSYLYFGAIKFGPNDYPLFYLPVTISLESQSSSYLLRIDPRLYVHKQAIEYIANEMRNQSERVGVAIVPERILHLSGDDTALSRIEQTMQMLSRTFDVAAQVDFHQQRPQIARSPQLRLSNASYFAAFDRNDESLVNDYEALLSSLEEDHIQASSMFNGIVKSMLFDDPISVSAEVREDWNSMTPAQHLVTSSPIPLNEEQIRIDKARKKKGCRFIAVEGPPGTGKSHTITALAFNAIMDNESVLIVSDKNEALDVVQDKLEKALHSIRVGENFPNPILRLGKDGTYRSLISGASKTLIQNHHAAQSANMPSLERELSEKTVELTDRVDKTVGGISQIELSRVARLHGLEATLSKLNGDLMAQLQDISISKKGEEIRNVMYRFNDVARASFENHTKDVASISDILAHCSIHAVVNLCHNELKPIEKQSLLIFEPMVASKASTILQFVSKIEALRMPVFGFLFRKSALADIDVQIATEFPNRNPIGISRKITELKAVSKALATIRANALANNVPDGLTASVYSELSSQNERFYEAQQVLQFVNTIVSCIGKETITTSMENRSGVSIAKLLLEIGEFIQINAELTKQFGAIPNVDFVAEKSRLERLNTARLAFQLDSRFIEFVEKNRATAQALGGVIKQRAQFPVDQFKTLREAFPCVIAGIRELGEFVPMKQEVFDLLIIDEGSQVSVAQAMPAMLRAKQVVIFGDRKQFSNVKSHNASNMTNAGYMSDLQDYFRQNVSTAADKLDRLQRFDVKRSVLEFVELVANHTEMLRKHFRGYPELISYSSKYFYDGALQAIKVRSIPLDEVFHFEVLQHDKRAESKKNTNSMEAERIIEILGELLEEESPPSVAIITPHTEQVALISALVSRHVNGELFMEKLRLKVFSFDTCQGEERDIIIYSMVATRERDVLNYIFPVKLGINEDENDTLKAQRLNVGFSRAKEGMIFVLSKEPEEFKGTIGQALMHFKRILETNTIAEEADTDPNSPMEKRLLGWLKNTSFFQQESDRIELIAQFPIGEYLRQLDPLYKHPAYKTDFLLRHMGNELTNIVIEYDGFDHHFVSREKVNSATYERYYKPEDVERQFVLESYGYRFLRINRFNLGSDPIATLDERLREMIDLTNEDESPDAVDVIKERVEALNNREAKQCFKCQCVKDLKDFFDQSLGNGKGGYGRACMACKAPKVAKPVKANTNTGTLRKRRWRRY